MKLRKALPTIMDSIMKWRKMLLFVGLPLSVGLPALYVFVQYSADFLWFRQLGFAGVFTTVLWAKALMFSAFFFIFALMGGVNTYFAGKGGATSRSDEASVLRSPAEAIANFFDEYGGIYIWAFMLICGTIYWPKFLPFTSIIVMIAVILSANIRLERIKRQHAEPLQDGDADPQTSPLDTLRLEKRLSYIWVLFIILLSGVMGMMASREWLTFLKFMHQSQFGAVEPIFSKDAGFYVYSLPLYYFFIRWCAISLVLVIGAVVLVYYLNGEIDIQEKRVHISSRPKTHLAVLCGLAALVAAWFYRLKIYGLMHLSTGAIRGAGYADIHAKMPAYWLLITFFVLLSFSLFILPAVKKWRWAAYVFGLSFVFCVSFSWIVPGVIQRYVVKPDELAKETPYIKNNIRFTRLGFGLDKAIEEPFPIKNSIQYEDIQNNDSTIHNIRLWDHRPLIQTYKQLQEIRLYYDFKNVDMDRYHLGNKYTEVAIAGRELPVDKLAGSAMTWVNKHLVYTHGYGAVMSPVNEFTSDGMPNFIIKDIPPRSGASLAITQPEIYYGEANGRFAIVHTTTKEFDYPKGDLHVYTTYHGTGGIRLSSFFRRLAFCLKLSDLNILLSGCITENSRIMFNRDVKERERIIAPFLTYDRDPYIVVGADGHLYWIHDAYTTTTMFPYSQSLEDRPDDAGINYIRNSVKVVVDAYSGDVSFYLINTSDPLALTYQKIFPDLFKPVGDMPEFLKEHLRYPKDLFVKQAKMYATYHMTDPQVFYNREDLWSIPKQDYLDKKQSMLPYYIIMKLPDADKEEFILMLPMTPSKRDNMIAWMCARCDGDKIGQLLTFTLSKDELIYGPQQIEARINQQPGITSEMTLWGQIGTRVIRGNLLTIPIANSFMYIEPIYLQSKKSQMPQLKRVIAIQNDQLKMAKNLDAALRAVFSAADVSGAKQKKDLHSFSDDRLPALAEEALAHYHKAQEHLARTKLGKFEEELDRIRQILQTMVIRHKK